jgi:hypothetical protein
MKIFKRVLSILIMLIFLSGCSAVQKIISNPTPELLPGSVLFSDNFSTNEAGWKTWNQDNAYVNIEGGGLYFLIDESEYDYWSKPGFKFENVVIQTDAIKVGGPNNNSYGVICRMVDESNFYAFLISSDGYAGILRVKEGIYELLNHNSMEFFAEIVQGEALNQMTASCNGSQLSLGINGKIVLQEEDTSFSVRDIAFIAGTFAEPGVKILFDNLVVLQP